jgi:hypothetical protein
MALVALLAFCALFQLTAAALPNCSYPGIFAFGDSLTDTGNSIAAFPELFKDAELDPNGQEFPMHAADRYTDGKLLLDFLAFGVRRRPIYPVLRGTGAPFTFGTNFAAYGGPARSVKVWKRGSGFNSPFSLDVQLEWMHRYKIRVWFYENPKFNPPSRGFVQSLPKLDTFNTSLFVVYAGYQDYFFSLYEQKLTIKQTHMIVDDVVKAISTHIKGMFKPYLYIPPDFPSLYMPTPRDVMVINMPPLGCIPALLTQFAGKGLHYDKFGCIKELNDISLAHNWKLNEAIVKLRKAYPSKKIVLADNYAVYYDILSDPLKYGVTDPLKACCGKGGWYNFNKKVTCGHAGMVEGKFVNLTMTLPVQPCKNLSSVLSWDGIHMSNTFNKAAATAFLTGKHVTPAGGLNCSPDFFFFPFRT